MIRTKLKYFLCMTLISSCAGFTDFNNLNYIFRNTFSSDFQASKDFYDNFPYSYALVRLNRNNEILMVLESVKDSKYTWVSNDGIRITIYRGLLIQTEGFNNDLLISNMSEFFNPNMFDDFVSKISFTDPVLIQSPITIAVNKDNNNIHVAKHLKDIKLRQSDFIKLNSDGLVEEATYNLAPGIGKIKAHFYYKY